MWFVHIKRFSHPWLMTVLPLRLTALAFMITVSSVLQPSEDDPKIFVVSSML